MRPKHLPDSIEWPTDEEEAAIQRGIALDPDNPEWTEEDWKQARPMCEVMPQFVEQMQAEQRVRRMRGPQKAPTKQLVSLRLDRDVVARLRASGPGWQVRANALLRRAVMGKQH